MHRRQLLTNLLKIGATTMVPFGAARARAPQRMLWLHHSRIAGSHYYRLEQIVQLIQPDDPLTLQRQTDNRHDPAAIEVFWKNEKIGYVPRRHNTAAASLMDRGYQVEARVLRLMDQDEVWEPLELRIWLIDGLGTG